MQFSVTSSKVCEDMSDDSPPLTQTFEMITSRKKTITTTLPPDELAEFDRVRDRQSLSRSQALRQAIRWYIGAMRFLPPAEEPLPDEIEAIGRGQEQIARGQFVRLEDLQRELGLPTE